MLASKALLSARILLALSLAWACAGCMGIVRENSRTIRESTETIANNTKAVTRSTRGLRKMEPTMKKVADLAPRMEDVAALGPSLETVGGLRAPMETLAERTQPRDLVIGGGVFLLLLGVVIYVSVMLGVRHGLVPGRARGEGKN